MTYIQKCEWLKPDTVRRRLKADGGFWIDGADIGRKEPGSAG